MRWWSAFDGKEVAADFRCIARAGFDSVRVFLLWEDFQPSPAGVAAAMLKHLVATLDHAGNAGLAVMPTLFTGHMSGVNWVPAWALADQPAHDRFRAVAGGRVAGSRPANWYADPSIVHAQALLAGESAKALAGHPALWAWDLGNENSNCSVPPNKLLARDWLCTMANALRQADANAKVTVGLHMEDMEQDRNLGPHDAAQVCTFLTMHGYPGYAHWANGPTDQRLLPFLARLTGALSGGMDVLFSEFGVPTRLKDDAEAHLRPSAPALVSERAAAQYVGRSLAALHQCGVMGAMLWCYADYAKALWKGPPFDESRHERSFGLWRSDGTEKPAVDVVRRFGAQGAARTAGPSFVDSTWMDVDVEEYYRTPQLHLPRLFGRYCHALAASQLV